MGSIFGSYSTAMTGIYASQTALNVISNNISNVDTKGYVRQQAIAMEKSPISSGEFSVGTGNAVQEIRQRRSSFLDKSYRSESSSLGYWQSEADTGSEIESILGDLTSVSIDSSMDSMFSGWEELAKNPEDLTERALVVEAATAFADTLSNIYRQLERVEQDTASQVSEKVDEINDKAGRIAQLNTYIMEAQARGDNANDYKDKVNKLIDEISYIMDVNVSQDDSGMYNISVEGSYIVNGGNANTLYVENGSKNSVTIKWTKNDKRVDVGEGELLGLIESGAEPDSLVGQAKEKLDTLAGSLAQRINELHNSGTGLDGSTGIDFFVKADDSIEFGAGNIKVNPEFENLNKIAASSDGDAGRNDVANDIAAVKYEDFIADDGMSLSCYDYYSSVVSWLGTTCENAKDSASNQNTLVGYIQNQRDSLSAVSMEEEMTNMITYQQAYNANAKLMDAIDEMIEALMDMVQ